MSKLLVALIAGAFAAVAVAQAPATKMDKQADVKSATEAAAKETTGAKAASDAKANTAKSKMEPKALTDKGAKQAAVKGTTEAQAKETTGAATAAEAKANTAKSKMEPKAAKPNLRDPAVQEAQKKAATQ